MIHNTRPGGCEDFKSRAEFSKIQSDRIIHLENENETLKSKLKDLQQLADQHENDRKELLGKIAVLENQLNLEQEKENNPFPKEPVKVAEILICSEEWEDYYGEKRLTRTYSKDRLRQIAEHLLIYCNGEE